MIYLGKITMTHGLKGELKLYTSFSKAATVLQPGHEVYIDSKPFKIDQVRYHKNHYLVLFEHYHSINLVEELRGKEVYFKREILALKEDEVLVEELVGFAVYENEELLGKVCNVVYNKSGVLIAVQGKKKFYIPYQENFIVAASLEEKKLLVKQAKGLIL